MIFQFVGNLTDQITLRETASGIPVLNFIAVWDRPSELISTPTGTITKTGTPVFIPCAMFGQRAKEVHSQITKGTKVSISGVLRNVPSTKALEVDVKTLDFVL